MEYTDGCLFVVEDNRETRLYREAAVFLSATEERDVRADEENKFGEEVFDRLLRDFAETGLAAP